MRSSAPANSTRRTRRAFPGLAPALIEGSGPWWEKSVYLFDEHLARRVVRNAPLLGVAIPRRVDVPPVRLSARQAFLAMAPNTVFQLPGAASGGERGRQGGRVEGAGARTSASAATSPRSRRVSPVRAHARGREHARRRLLPRDAGCDADRVGGRAIAVHDVAGAAAARLPRRRRAHRRRRVGTVVSTTDLDAIDEESFRHLPLAWHRLRGKSRRTGRTRSRRASTGRPGTATRCCCARWAGSRRVRTAGIDAMLLKGTSLASRARRRRPARWWTSTCWCRTRAPGTLSRCSNARAGDPSSTCPRALSPATHTRCRSSAGRPTSRPALERAVAAAHRADADRPFWENACATTRPRGDGRSRRRTSSSRVPARRAAQ